MRIIFAIFACLAAASLGAATIGHVEYQLPSQGQAWKVAHEFKGKHAASFTVLYIPENTTHETAQEFFAAHVNNIVATFPNTKAFEREIRKGIEMLYRDSTVTVSVIKQMGQSYLYEWSLSDAGEEKIHGWGRGFPLPSETVLLNYQTEALSHLDEQRQIWVPILEAAKIIP